MKPITRKEFIQDLSLIAAATLLPALSFAEIDLLKKSKMKLGLVTYLWGKDWDVPTLIENCTKSGIGGVELRVDHAHKVMPDISAARRMEVKKMFADSPIKIVGMGTNEQYDSPDPAKLKANMDRTKEFIKLSANIGGTGVKVKPNQFHKDVPHEKTLEQIGRSLSELGKYAEDFGQKIRLEVHGNGTQELPNIKTIMDYTENRNASVCWNCNAEDLIGQGLEYNFNLVKDRFGDTVHVRELDDTSYPYQKLMNLFKEINYKGWILLECRTDPKDKVAALIQQKEIFNNMIKG
jgi:sugar phosphate isomerase/epimerase